MAYTRILKQEILRSFDTATLSGTYQNLGTSLAHPATMVKIVNTSSVAVIISIDGVNDYDICPASSFFLYDITANTPSQGDDAIFVPEGTQYSVKGTAGTGLVYLVVNYIVQA